MYRKILIFMMLLGIIMIILGSCGSCATCGGRRTYYRGGRTHVVHHRSYGFGYRRPRTSVNLHLGSSGRRRTGFFSSFGSSSRGYSSSRSSFRSGGYSSGK